MQREAREVAGRRPSGGQGSAGEGEGSPPFSSCRPPPKPCLSLSGRWIHRPP